MRQAITNIRHNISSRGSLRHQKTEYNPAIEIAATRTKPAYAG
jgi:hypothetical protein